MTGPGFDDSWTIWLSLFAIALVTTLPRASFIVLGSRVPLPPRIQRALRYAPAAALAAVVAPDLLVANDVVSLLNPRLGAGLVVLAVASRWRNPFLPFIAGMGSLWALQYLA
ncbi:MAG: AzlD domain-containing protein [Chromatiales bacterium]|nr:AzlD domain-containing protein [Chromatiales bacterium]